MLAPRVQAYLNYLFAEAGEDKVPGSWLAPDSVLSSKLAPSLRADIAAGASAYSLRVSSWTPPLSYAAGVASLSYDASLQLDGTNRLSVNGSGIVMDHGSLTGLADDDHPQYSNSALSVYAAGTAYVFTAVSALLDFGTTDPSLTITSPGTYLIRARVRVQLAAATFAATQVITLKLRRTNNTPADIANSECYLTAPVSTTLTQTISVCMLPEIIYTTTNSDDVLEIWGDVAVIPSAGELRAAEASIVAVKLY